MLKTTISAVLRTSRTWNLAEAGGQVKAAVLSGQDDGTLRVDPRRRRRTASGVIGPLSSWPDFWQKGATEHLPIKNPRMGSGKPRSLETVQGSPRSILSPSSFGRSFSLCSRTQSR